MIRVENGDARDIPAIMPIMEAAFDPAFGEAWTAAQCLSSLSLPYSHLWLAYLDELLVGFAITRWVMDEEELLMIGVLPAARRKKVAATMLSEIIGNASASNRSKVFLEVRDGNDATTFYKNQGFKIVGRRAGYYSGQNNKKYDAITMVTRVQ